MRRFILLLILLVSFSAYGQVYRNNPNYIYGEGVGKTVEEADTRAMQALTGRIKTKVDNYTTYTLISENKTVSERFEKNVNLYSSMDVEDSEREVVYGKKKVTVVRYVNRTEYCKQHISNYQNYRNLADSLENMYRCEIPHCTNLILGAIYNAYRALDTDMMDAFFAENIDIKNNLIKEAEHYYACYDIYENLYEYEGMNHTTEVWAKNSNVPGFKYLSNGEWKDPYGYCAMIDNKLQGVHFPMPAYKTCECYISMPYEKNVPIRLNYEMAKGNHFIIMAVPENWYFENIYL